MLDRPPDPGLPLLDEGRDALAELSAVPVFEHAAADGRVGAGRDRQR
jgi:hypothetical protein